jgi:hypothetical protein
MQSHDLIEQNSYAWNNPLIYTDPDGEFVHLIIGAIIPDTKLEKPGAQLIGVCSVISREVQQLQLVMEGFQQSSMRG